MSRGQFLFLLMVIGLPLAKGTGGTSCSGSSTDKGTCTKAACPMTCAEVYSSASSPPSSGIFTLTNAQGQSFRIYCLFKSGYGYTFLSSKINVDPNLAQQYTEKKEVLIRHKRTNGQQYDVTAAQITRYSSKDLGILYNSFSGYQENKNAHMTPYLYLGFIPKYGVSHYHDIQGWRVQGVDYTFKNCDGNPHSYFALLYNSQNKSYATHSHGKTDLLNVWYKYANATSMVDYIPDEFLATQFEIHFGGCGGYSTSTAFSDVTGASIGLKFDMNGCASNPCKNGATCSDEQNNYNCTCTAGWTGTNCNTDIDECQSNPCQNGAVCNNLQNNYTCSCTGGWQGINCDIDIDECASNPCQNGAACNNSLNMYTCDCVPGWQGYDCDQVSETCAEVYSSASSPPSSGIFTLTNAQGQSFRIYCLFKSGYGYTFLSSKINVDPNLAQQYTEKKEVLIRHKRTNGQQYDVTAAQITRYSSKDLGILYNSFSGYQENKNAHMTPYLYLGFIPKYGVSHYHDIQGWRVQGVDYTFKNCDGNPHSYFALLYNSQNKSYATHSHGKTDLLNVWYKYANATSMVDYIPDEFLATQFEIHFGGCGGYSTSTAFSDVTGASIGLKFDMNGCASNPCKNGATCSDEQNNYNCTCTAGWTGTNCNTDIDECQSNPCQNGAVCNNLQNNYTCSCTGGWQGINCDIDIDECASNPCQNGAACNNSLNMYTCDCVPGWQGYDCDQVSETCAEVYSSASSPPSSGIFTLANAQGQSFRVYCLFKSGYGYTFLSSKINVDPNLAQQYTEKKEVLIRHKRTNGQQYDVTAAQITRYSSKDLGILYNSYSGYQENKNAHMTPYLYLGFIPKYGVSHYHDIQGWRVQGVDYTFKNCDGNPHSYFALLYNSQNKSYATHSHGKTDLLNVWYKYANATSVVDYIPDEFFATQFEIHFGGCGGYSTSTAFSDVTGASIGLKFDMNGCASNPCKNGAACSDEQNNYNCTCTEGWTGTNCNTDIDECQSNPCQNGAVCNNLQNNYTCSCTGGWQGINCDIDIDECASNPCQNGAACNNSLNMYTCDCVPGWQGYDCNQDIDECLSNPCQNGAVCNNLQNNYTCSCTGGWQGINCDIDIDECASNPCQNGAACNNSLNMYTCDCIPGWQGYDCDQDIDECLSNPCQNGAVCNNLQNNYTCSCTGGWQGINCDIDIDECTSNPCQNGAACNNSLNMYTCDCSPGWQGYDCDQDIDECLSNPCQNGAVCNNLQNNYTCSCTGGYQGTNCDIDIDECASNPCQNGAACNNSLNMYTCDCVPGWQGYDCDQDIDECLSNPCQNGAVCNNLQNNYTCSCTGGWEGTNCDIDIDECLSSPCVNGTCTNLRNAYRCTCYPQYTARNCDYLIGSPIDGQWGQWGSWQGCSVTCGTGRQRQYRACDDPPPDYGGEPCVGDSFKEKVCSGAGSCPVSVDGNWGAWSVATLCSVTCGTGHSVRTRSCNNPAPSNGGNVCTGDAMAVGQCTLTACPSSMSSNGTGSGSGSSNIGANYVSNCPAGWLTCSSGSITCIDEEFKCDCVEDCYDGSDETEIWAGCDPTVMQLCGSAPGLKKRWLFAATVYVFIQLAMKLL